MYPTIRTYVTWYVHTVLYRPRLASASLFLTHVPFLQTLAVGVPDSDFYSLHVVLFNVHLAMLAQKIMQSLMCVIIFRSGEHPSQQITTLSKQCEQAIVAADCGKIPAGIPDLL
jgi:hypothetical protein